MKLFYSKTSKDPTYYVQKGFRVGKKTTTKNIHRIGKHSELLKITDDPLAYAKQIVAQFNEETQASALSMDVKIDFSEKVLSSKDTASSSTMKNIGYFALQAIYHNLRIREFFKDSLHNNKITFAPNDIIRFLIFSRILNPTSKLGTYKNLHRYYEDPDFQYQHILRAMDLLADHYDEYIEHLFTASNNLVQRNTSVCYFDCTNYYCETESADEDYVDDVTGEVFKGLRRYGPSKEHRPNPIVEMGLFMDAQGLPLSMCIAPVSANEQTVAIPLEKKLVSMLKGKKFIYCADAGLGSLNIRRFNAMGGRAFIVTQSVKKLSDTLKQAVFNDCSYRRLSDDRPSTLRQMQAFDRHDETNLALYNDRVYKVIPADKLVDLGLYEETVQPNGTRKKTKAKRLMPQNLIVFFSRKMMEYQRAIRNRQIQRAKNLLASLNPDSYKKGPHDVTRFIGRRSYTKAGGAVQEEFFLNDERIKEEEKYDGFYCVATNLSDSAKDILAISDKRYKIEECFRILKTNFSARPIYHHLPKRITAHFMICYTALLIYRLLEIKLNEFGQSCCAEGEHYTTDAIIQTLQNMNVQITNDMYYSASYTGSKVLTALNAVFTSLNLDRKYYLPKDLNKKLRNFK